MNDLSTGADTLSTGASDLSTGAVSYTHLWPGETINIVCKVLAAGLIILGGVELFSYITNRNGYMFTGILGPVSYTHLSKISQMSSVTITSYLVYRLVLYMSTNTY